MRKSIKLKAGDKFNMLTIIKLSHIKKYINKKTGWKNRKQYYLCKCDCDNTCSVEKNQLKRGIGKSCGCLRKEAQTTHGISSTKLYQIVKGIRRRCLNKKEKSYKNYGGRGITICKQWLESPKAFYNWAMANGYKEGLTIDRIDNDGNYKPSNCRWVTYKVQSRNRRSNRILSYKGKKKTLIEWSEIFNIKKSCLKYRLDNGWSIEKALTQKSQRC